MLISRAKHRYVWLAAVVLLVLLFLVRNDDSRLSNFWIKSSSGGRAWIYKGPEAQDKAVILAKMKTEDVGWVSSELPEYVVYLSKFKSG